jgi:hypothetical protein
LNTVLIRFITHLILFALIGVLAYRRESLTRGGALGAIIGLPLIIVVRDLCQNWRRRQSLE